MEPVINSYPAARCPPAPRKNRKRRSLSLAGADDAGVRHVRRRLCFDCEGCFPLPSGSGDGGADRDPKPPACRSGLSEASPVAGSGTDGDSGRGEGGGGGEGEEEEEEEEEDPEEPRFRVGFPPSPGALQCREVLCCCCEATTAMAERRHLHHHHHHQPAARSPPSPPHRLDRRAGKRDDCAVCGAWGSEEERRRAAGGASVEIGRGFGAAEAEALLERDCGSGSVENVIVTQVDGLHCDGSIFKGITEPYLYQSPLSPRFLSVYVPHREELCAEFCERVCLLDKDHHLGKGAFGSVYAFCAKRVAAKVAHRTRDMVLDAWISGVVRARSRDFGSRQSSIYNNLLIPSACCVRHRLTVSSVFDTDMFHYNGWSVAGVVSYKAAFFGLADGLRFLSLECGVSHFDVTPMNILVDVDRRCPWNIERAVLCDYSLSEPHPQHRGLCVVILEETRTARRLQPSRYRISECYHPAFRPLPLQLLAALNPRGNFDRRGSPQYCVAELAALGNVMNFCMARVLDQRGLGHVKSVGENMLFRTATMACTALERENAADYAQSCLLIVARQLAYAQHVLGEQLTSAQAVRVQRFVEARFSEAWARKFKAYLSEGCSLMSHAYVKKNLDITRTKAAGATLLAEMAKVARVCFEEDLNADPRLFIADP